MKKSLFLLLLCAIFVLAGCDSGEKINGLSLPFSAEEIEVVELIHHTGDPMNSEQKWITGSEDINYIHNMLSAEILIGSRSVDASAQTDTLYITFHQYDGTGYKVKFESYGVKKGIVSSSDSPEFIYFTSADICWIWGMLARDYESQDISIEDEPYSTEKPMAVEPGERK